MQKYKEITDKIILKVKNELNKIGTGIAYIPENGRYTDIGEKDICWWTNGFWPGLLWQCFNYSEDEQFKTGAQLVENRLDKAFDDFLGLHHDVGFMYLPSSVIDYKLTKGQRCYARSLHAATLLAGRYNSRGQYIRCWNDDKVGWVIIDSLLNIPLLYWASKETKDPRFAYVAISHADTLLKQIVREDYSCRHIAVLDPKDGSFVEENGGQGYSVGSAWSRGQSWGIYGFAQSYKYTRDEKYLIAAKEIAKYFISQIELQDWKTVVDFRAPDLTRYDSTAGVITASGMLDIASFCEAEEKEYYVCCAKKILDATDKYFADYSLENDGIVDYGTASYHGEDNNHVKIIYGDYYYLEALLKLQNKALEIW